MSDQEAQARKRRTLWIVIAIVLVGLGAVAQAMYLSSTGLSFESFPLDGGGRANITNKYSQWGMRTDFVIVRIWPASATAEEMANDPRIQDELEPMPLVRDNAGKMIPVRKDGWLYFLDDEHGLRTMRINMREAIDVPVTMQTRTAEQVWEGFKQFEVTDPSTKAR